MTFLVTKTKNTPFFDHLDKNHYFFFELSYKDKVYGYSAIAVLGTEAFFHLKLVEYSKEILISGFKDWDFIKDYCRNLGAKKISAINFFHDDNKWERFIDYFGFKKPKIFMISEREI